MSDWLNEFRKAGAIWLHDGEPKRPHALLTSGLHSDGFVNCTYVTQHPGLLKRIVNEDGALAGKLPAGRIDWVIGSPMGAITLAHEIAERLGCRAGFTEKDGDAMTLKRFELEPGARVLVCEDVVSTGGSTRKTIEAIQATGGGSGKVDILPVVIALVNRSGAADLDGRKIEAVVTPAIHTWKPEACPLCAKGSEAVRPKSHWKALTGT